MLPSLYPHQEEILNKVRRSLARHRSVILCAEPGVGKTRMARWILGKTKETSGEGRSGHVLFAVHRRGLVDNASSSFSEEPPLEHGVIMSGVEADWGQAIQVASIDTLMSWFVDGEGKYTTTQTYDVLVFDEAHSHTTKFSAFLAAHNAKREQLGLKPPFVLGLTATPQSKGLAQVFKDIVRGPSAEWLINNGFLKPYQYYRVTEGRLGLLVKKGEEYTSESVDRAMEGLHGDMVRDWLKHAQGRSTVGFFARRSYAKMAVELFGAAGVRVEYVDGETSDDERKTIFKMMRSGALDYIANVGVVERGTDLPRIGCVQLCLPVGSLVRYRQMIGRGSRPHPDVPDCKVLDHGGNWKIHGFFEDDVPWTLDWSQRASKLHKPRESVSCPKCDRVYRGGLCVNCGYKPQAKELKAQGLKFDGRELQKIDRRKVKTSRGVQDPEKIWVNALYRAGRGGKTFKQAVGIAYSEANRGAAIGFKLPKWFTVAGKKFETVPYGADDQRRKVSDLYPFTIGNYNPADNPYFVETVRGER